MPARKRETTRLYAGAYTSSAHPQLSTATRDNAAAHALLTGQFERGVTLADILGDDIARRLLNGADGEVIELATGGGEHHYFRAMCNTAVGEDGEHTVQIVLNDVTTENLRHRQMVAYAAHVLSAQEEERHRIALELHDQPVQALVHLCRTLDRANEAASFDARAHDELRAARATAEEIISGLRTIARGLRPPALDDLGPVACVRRLVVDLRERTGIRAMLTVTGPEVRLASAAELALFRITQEALSNVERHASPRCVDVDLSFVWDEVSILVSDDGVGFVMPTIATAGAPTSLGIMGMHERAALVGGRVKVTSAPQTGTRVLVVLPLRRHATNRGGSCQPAPAPAGPGRNAADSSASGGGPTSRRKSPSASTI